MGSSRAAGAAQTVLEEGPYTLSSTQVRRLLDALAFHKDLLESSHQDARRQLQDGYSPSYVVDFQLLYRYMYDWANRPDWSAELEYLLARDDATLLIGPGTALEILGQLRRVVGTAAPHVYASLPEWTTLDHLEEHLASGEPAYLARSLPQTLRGLLEKAEDEVVALFRLSRLLEHQNLYFYDDLVDEPGINQRAFDATRSVLDSLRPTSDHANLADALNFGVVVHIRETQERNARCGYPYLLTSTTPLLDERQFWESVDDLRLRSTVSRDPLSAIYSHVLFEEFPDPASAARHTMNRAYQAAALEYDLRQIELASAEYEIRRPRRGRRKRGHEIEVARSELYSASETLRERIPSLADFVSDLVVQKTQQVYDSAELTDINLAQLKGDVSRHVNSPRRLFDLVLGIASALERSGQETAGPTDDTWASAIQTLRAEREGYRVIEFVPRPAGEVGTPYLRAEIHYGSGQEGASSFRNESPRATESRATPPREASNNTAIRPDTYCVLSWPSSIEIDRLLSSFSDGFLRHRVREADLIVGTRSGPEFLVAELPIDLNDLMPLLAHDGDEALWIRMESPGFDLYADVISEAGALTYVGVLSDSPDMRHVAELFEVSSARYLFPPWVRKMLQMVEDEAAAGPDVTAREGAPGAY